MKGEGPVEALPLEDCLHDVVVGSVQPERVVAKPLAQDCVSLCNNMHRICRLEGTYLTVLLI